MKYLLGESDSGLFGSNSNLGGPVWIPTDYLLVETTRSFHHFYADWVKIKCPIGSRIMSTLNEVAAVSFTGSIETGHKVAAACTSGTPMKKFQLEMGGKNPLVVLDDADLTIAVDCAVNGAYSSTGQRCTASSRLIVTASIHDRFVDGLTDRLKKLVVDDALKPGTEMGPVVDENQLDHDRRYLDVGKSEGARLHWGGERLNRENPGFYLQPAVFTEVTNQMRIAREEIFGRLGAVICVKDYEEALTTANDTPFGLSAGIATTSIETDAEDVDIWTPVAQEIGVPIEEIEIEM